ncbi:sensitivity to high expression protein she9 [Diaporthe australafricana]|uniref:Sensitive to high expression protein 9, mitochondrial n=1 Tax=Diaporthe australafricana TaxID=127596 RepID=A0ABR3WFK2_9PEZI
MPGPVAAARPILRPGSSLLLKQLSGPVSVSISASSRSRAAISTILRLTSSSSRAQLSLRTAYGLQSRLRLYSTNPPPPDPNASSKEAKEPSEPTQTSSTSSPSSPSSSPESPSSSAPSRPSPELPSQTDSRRSAASQNFSHFMDNLQSRVLVASQTLNDLTGYSAIEAIKAANATLETDLAQAQATLKRARQHYKAVNAQRASTQREVTALLARKDTWTPPDLERFTTMYRQDHELEAAVGEAAADLTEAEADQARLSQALNSGILRRYHEEQIWSDRIRRQSTWGTWGLMGVNILLFLVLQFVAEPWKRNRLMKGIAAEEKAALEAVRRELEEVRGAMTRREDAAAAAAVTAAEAVPAAVAEDAGVEAAPVASLPDVESPQVPVPPPGLSWKEFLSDPGLWRPALKDLYSERTIDLRMRDVSLIALESAVTGAVAVAGVAVLLARQR